MDQSAPDSVQGNAPPPVQDFAQARDHMVDGQVRPNKVIDPRIIRAMRSLPRERFLPPHLAAWAEHCRELRGRVTELARAGRLTFGSWDRTRTTVVTDPGEALVILLSPAVSLARQPHMVADGPTALRAC